MDTDIARTISSNSASSEWRAQNAASLPKQSSQTQQLDGKANLVRLRQTIPLSDAELAAVDEGIVAMKNLIGQLADVPTPGSDAA